MGYIDKILVFKTTGLPIVMLDFGEDKLIVNEALLTGFLSAIEGLSSNIFQNTSDHFVINQGVSKISTFKSNSLIFALIGEQEFLHLKEDLLDLMKIFAEEYDLDTAEIKDPSTYELFKIKLIRILFFEPISEDWIPKTVIGSLKKWKLDEQYPLLKEIDGKREVHQLPGYSNKKKENFYEILNYAYYEGAIEFGNYIEPRDFIVGTEKLFSLIYQPPMDFDSIQAQFKSFKLFQIAKHLKSHVQVNYLQECFNPEIIHGLEKLYRHKYIEIIDEKRRNILILASLSDDLLKMVQTLGKRSKIRKEILEFLENFPDPLIFARIDLTQKELSINMDNLIPRSRNQLMVDQMIMRWTIFGKALVQHFYTEHQKKLNSIFYIKLMEKYMNYLHISDLDILDPILSSIEAACTD